MFRAPVIAAAVAAVCIASPAAAQSQEELARALGNFTQAQSVLGMNHSCEVLEANELAYAQSLVRQLQSPLRRALGERFDPDAIYENARAEFEGCKTREQAPQAWAQIDGVRDLGNMVTVAASRISVSLDSCVRNPVFPVYPEEVKAAADIALAAVDASKREQVTTLAGQFASAIDAECAKQSTLQYPMMLGPAVASVFSHRQKKLAQGSNASAQLQAFKPVEKVMKDDWLGHTRSSNVFVNAKMFEFYATTGYRSYGERRAVANISLRSGGTYSGNGDLYLSDKGMIEARVDGDFDSILLTTVEGNRTYILKRTNPDVKPDFFGQNKAEFQIFESDRERFFRENDENTDFFVRYRPSAKASPKAFMIGSSEPQPAKFNLGDLMKAFQWATAPSALDR